ncbi:Poly(A)+ RNA export protein [Armillaria nabsnona]|nr:Poly(A)+ RNA export protein [Armillaria nabsnona]
MQDPKKLESKHHLEDISISHSFTDSISSLSFSPLDTHLAVASWDGQVAVYNTNPSLLCTVVMTYNRRAPVLSVAWKTNGQQILFGRADNLGMMVDAVTGSIAQFAQHNTLIKVVKSVNLPYSNKDIVITGSWDKTVKYWDLCVGRSIGTTILSERCYALDVIYSMMVVGTAGKDIPIFDLRHLSEPVKSLVSPLKFPPRTISCFKASNEMMDAAGFAIGSVEGHGMIFAINSISCHPVHGTLVTCGSDGVINFWDKDLRTFLRWPIPCASFNPTGDILAYAVSYDWSKGHVGMAAGNPNHLMLHVCEDDEIKRRQRPT